MQKSFSFFGLAVVLSISGPLICTEGAVLVRPWGIEGVSGPDPVPNVFGLLMYSENITTFHLLQAVMSGVVLWFQHCNPPCYSSFSAAATCHCKLRYLPVSQNGWAKFFPDTFWSNVTWVLTADLITVQENRKAQTIHHSPAKDCLVEIVYRIHCTLNLWANCLGSFLLPRYDWELLSTLMRNTVYFAV